MLGLKPFYGMEPSGWGAVSEPAQLAEKLCLSNRVSAMPAGGVLLDVGAGLMRSAGAAVYLQRQDIQIVSLDPGYALDSFYEERDEAITELIGHVPEDDSHVLGRSNDWHRLGVAAVGETLPFKAESVDLITSYAANEHYDDQQRAVEECVRVLKVGGFALHGPMMEHTFMPWNYHATNAQRAGEIAGYSHRFEEMMTSYGYPVQAYFTEIQK